ncbi:MAG: BMP family lipoprotein [Bacillota bacterium]
MNRKSLFVVALLLLVALVAGCVGGEEAQEQEQSSQEEQVEELNVGIVLSSGGKGDKSFNDSALRGLSRAKEEGVISDYKYLEPKQVSVVEKNLRFLAEEGYDLVIGVGFMQKDAVTKVSKEFPDTNFAIIDEVVNNDNVASITFKEHQGSFLAGAFAALMTNHDELEGINEEQVVGFLGGMDMPLIHKFELGYTSGIEYINKTEDTNVKAKVAYAGGDPQAFNDPAKGKEIALSQYDSGADIIYHAAGGTGGGLFNAAEKVGRYAIGVDSDQDYIEPGHILTTMQKRVDNAVYDIVENLKDDDFTAGVKEYGLPKEGIKVSLSGLGPMTQAALESGDISEEEAQKIKDMKDMIPAEVKDKIKTIREKIIAGEIEVPNYLEQESSEE